MKGKTNYRIFFGKVTQKTFKLMKKEKNEVFFCLCD